MGRYWPGRLLLTYGLFVFVLSGFSPVRLTLSRLARVRASAGQEHVIGRESACRQTGKEPAERCIRIHADAHVPDRALPSDFDSIEWRRSGCKTGAEMLPLLLCASTPSPMGTDNTVNWDQLATWSGICVCMGGFGPTFGCEHLNQP